MSNKEVEARIRRSFTKQTPDILSSVLSDCREGKGQWIMVNETKKRAIQPKRLIAAAAAVVVLITGIVAAWMYQSYHAMTSLVSLDVNPSIEIQVNRKEKVLAVTPMNQDGQVVVGDMDFKGSSLDVTVNALIGSMLRSGYVNEMANSVLISVENDDAQTAVALQEKLTEAVEALLKTEVFRGAVLSQVLPVDTTLQQLADTYGITKGKAQLIQEIIGSDSRYSFEDLVSLSINELNLLRRNTDDTAISAVGSASDKAYIGQEAAFEKVLEHAGVKKAAVKGSYDWELDYDDGMMVYEIEFTDGSYGYDYEVEASTGRILDSKKERTAASGNNAGAQGSAPADSSVPSADITVQRAQEIVFAHAGVAADSVRDYSIEKDRENGQPVYEIEFKSNGYEYSYQIHRTTGAVVQSKKETDDDAPTKPAVSSSAAGQTASDTAAKTISREQAKEIVLAHAKVSVDNLRDYEIELDHDNGVTVYEIEFKAGGYEYEYDINAATGSVMKFHKEQED